MSDQTPNSSSAFAKYFSWIAWLLALGLMVFVFNDYLASQANPNQQVATYTNEYGKAEVSLERNRQGHYVTSGFINQQAVTFLVDTGATEVSIPAPIAKNLGLNAQGSYWVSTANGSTKVYQTTIAELQIGALTLFNIRANINPSMHSDEILLGMSALKKVEFSQSGSQLVLREP